MDEKLVTIAQFSDSVEAELAKQMLADFDIKSILTGQHATNVYAGVPTIARIELQVLESQAQEALEILETNKKEGE